MGCNKDYNALIEIVLSVNEETLLLEAADPDLPPYQGHRLGILHHPWSSQRVQTTASVGQLRLDQAANDLKAMAQGENLTDLLMNRLEEIIVPREVHMDLATSHIHIPSRQYIQT